MATRITDEMASRHLRLLNDLADHFNPEVNQQEYDQFLNSCRGFLPPLTMKKSHNLLELFKNLEKKGKLAVMKYDKLKEIVKPLNKTLLDMIDDAEKEIENLKPQPVQDDAGPPSSRVTNLNVPSTSGVLDLQHPSTENTAVPSTSTPKRKRVDGDDNYTYNDDNRKGFLVILNFTQNRAGTQHDEENLKKFFEDSLHWEVEIRQDLTYDRMDRFLGGIQERLSDRGNASKYYCLLVAIMSHGNKDGIYPHDHNKEVEEKQVYEYDKIFNFFKNDQIKAFAGKPKVFMVQACRGSQIQGEVIRDDNDPMDVDVPEIPGPAVRISIPVDADMLIMWATTPGFKAFRGELSGSHFFQEVVEQFKQNYDTDHVEAMLLKVRHTFAHTDKFRKRGQTKHDGKTITTDFLQMPCTWTTLTKMLYLK